MSRRCTFAGCITPSTCGPVAIARVTCNPSGNVVYLCRECLNSWLDNADDEPELEPLELHRVEAT